MLKKLKKLEEVGYTPLLKILEIGFLNTNYCDYIYYYHSDLDRFFPDFNLPVVVPKNAELIKIKYEFELDTTQEKFKELQDTKNKIFYRELLDICASDLYKHVFDILLNKKIEQRYLLDRLTIKYKYRKKIS